MWQISDMWRILDSLRYRELLVEIQEVSGIQNYNSHIFESFSVA